MRMAILVDCLSEEHRAKLLGQANRVKVTEALMRLLGIRHELYISKCQSIGGQSKVLFSFPACSVLSGIRRNDTEVN